MPKDVLEAAIYQHITLAKSAKITVETTVLDGLTLAAPLACNLNDKGTAFGGSLSMLATLTGWSWLQVFAEDQLDFAIDTMIYKSAIHYTQPIKTDFYAVCQLPDEAHLAKFTRNLAKRGTSRLVLHIDILDADKVRCVHYSGHYVAKKRI